MPIDSSSLASTTPSIDCRYGAAANPSQRGTLAIALKAGILPESAKSVLTTSNPVVVRGCLRFADYGLSRGKRLLDDDGFLPEHERERLCWMVVDALSELPPEKRIRVDGDGFEIAGNVLLSALSEKVITHHQFYAAMTGAGDYHAAMRVIREDRKRRESSKECGRL